jgi:cytochrome c
MNTRFFAAGARLAATALSGLSFASAACAQPAAPPLFAVCQACHETTAGAGPSVGPNLFAIGGRKAGTAKDFEYSDAMKSSPIVWSSETLSAFITDPNKTIPKNAMDYSGADAATAKAIADYLMTLKP